MKSMMRGFWVVIVLFGAAGCAGTSGRVAPIEDGRRVDKPDAVSTLDRPQTPSKQPEPTVKQVSPDARVYALPDAAIATPAPVRDALTPSDGPTARPPVPTDPVTAELLAQAERALARGDRGAARSTLERVIKLRPRDPVAWIELAELNHAEGEFEQALVVAQRARNLAGDDPAYLARIELVLARARARLAR